MRRAVLLGSILALAACGSATSGRPDEAQTLPPVVQVDDDTSTIAVSPDSEIARMLDTGVPARRFVAVDDVVHPAGVASLWEMSVMPAVDAEVASLASVLGIDGAVRAGDPNLGQTHVVGDLDDAGGQLAVSAFAEPFWGLQRAPSIDEPASVGVDEALEDAGVIDETVNEVMEAIGVRPGDVTVDSFVGGREADVRVEFTPDGLRTGVSWNFSIAPDGSIVAGGGPVRIPEVVDQVATVGLDDALLRLSRVAPGLAPPGAPLESTPIGTPFSAEDGADPDVTPPPSTDAPSRVLPTISTVEPGLVSVWDVSNRQLLVPALVVSSSSGFQTTIPIISADHVRVADLSEIEVPVRTGPPLTVPEEPPVNGPNTSMPLSTSTSIGTPATTAVAPPTDTAPPTPATTLSSTESTLPRPTVPDPPVTLLTTDGTPITVPIPPDPNAVTADAIPDFYAESINAFLVGRTVGEAVDLLQRTGWLVRTDDLDDPTETFTADVAVGRATVQHRNDLVVGVAVG